MTELQQLTADRTKLAEAAAIKAGFNDWDLIATWTEATEAAFASVQSTMVGDRSRGGRRRMRAMRRELTRSALVAAGVPGWIRAALWFGERAATLFPFPFNVVVPAVLWCVEQMIGEDD